MFGPAAARHVGGVSAWAYGLGWFPVAPINMILAARYIVELWNLPPGREWTPIGAPISTTVLIISIAGLLLLFIPCYKGIRLGTAFATVFGIISMVPLTLIVFLPFFQPSTMDWSRMRGFPLADPGHRQLPVLRQLGVHHDLVGPRHGGGGLLHRRMPESSARREDRDDRVRALRLFHLRQHPGDARGRARHDRRPTR